MSCLSENSSINQYQIIPDAPTNLTGVAAWATAAALLALWEVRVAYAAEAPQDEEGAV